MPIFQRHQKKVGLALGSGAARGLAHIGALAALEREHIPVDLISGTSSGALIGALYAQGKSAGEIARIAQDMDWRKRAFLVDLTLPKNGFIAGNRVKQLLRSIVGDIEFQDLKIPLACVATDIYTGEEIVIRDGLVWEAVRASISLPLIFAVFKWRGRYLVDGALTNPVPVSVARDMGADFVIAVNVIPHAQERIKPREGFKEPNFFDVSVQSLYIAIYTEVRSCLSQADAVIEPRMPQVGFGDFGAVQECLDGGEAAAQAQIPDIRRKLKSLGLRIPA